MVLFNDSKHTVASLIASMARYAASWIPHDLYADKTRPHSHPKNWEHVARKGSARRLEF